MSSDSTGQCILTRMADGQVRVDRADPCILISTELLSQEDLSSLYIHGDRITIGDINPVTYKIVEWNRRTVKAERVTCLPAH